MTPLDHYLAARSDRCSGCGRHAETQGCTCTGSEWALFVAALRQSVRPDGLISQNTVRPLVAGKIAPKRIARFWQLAQARGSERLIERADVVEDSTDGRGKNRHKAIPMYVWLGSEDRRAA